MRLLKLEENGDLSLKEFVGDETPKYAILSHTWGADTEEVTLKDLIDGTGKNKLGYQKIEFCAKQAATDGLQYCWVDTCCIDKTSSAELSEAINSMFRWYHESTKCYVFLPDISSEKPTGKDEASETAWEEAFRQSRWFTRGWTLQELLAPKSVEFFSMEGKRIGDKKSLGKDVHKVTGITESALRGAMLFGFPVEERLSWAANRKTKREEDAAYSLLGLFDINMPLIYGEGRKRAMARLYREIRDTLTNDPPALLRSDTDDSTKDQSEKKEDEAQLVAQPMYSPCAVLDHPPVSAAFTSLKEVDIFVLGDDSTMKHLRLEVDGLSSLKWHTDGKWFSNPPLVISRKRSRLEVFAPTPYGKVLYQETDNGLLMKEHWETIGQTIVSPLAGISRSPNRFDIFGLDKDGKVLTKTLDYGNWIPSKDGWEDLGGKFTLPVQVVSYSARTLDLFCLQNYNGPIRYKSFDGNSWKPAGDEWKSLESKFLSPPSVVSASTNRFDIFAIGTNYRLYHKWWKNGEWSWWYTVDVDQDHWISRPCAISPRPGRLELYCLKIDSQVWTRSYTLSTDGWKAQKEWTSLGGDFVSAPSAIASRSGKVLVFCKGYDDEIYYRDMSLEDAEWESLGTVS